MRIRLRYNPWYSKNDDVVNKADDRTFTAELDLPDRADISDVLPAMHARGLARCDSKGRVPLPAKAGELYPNSGSLEDGALYSVLSADTQKTLRYFKSNPSSQ